MLGKFLSNIYNPHSKDAERYLTHSHTDMFNGPSAMKAAWDRHLSWINSNVIDKPKATDTYTVEQLEAMGMVGVYAPVAD